jgi:hypothetical protein
MAARTWVESVRCLPRALPPTTLTAQGEQLIEQASFGSMSEQTTAKFGKHREIKAGIGQVQAEDILPVNAGAHGESLLSVCQSLPILHDGNQGKTPRRFGWLPTRGKQISKLFILKHGS